MRSMLPTRCSAASPGWCSLRFSVSVCGGKFDQGCTGLVVHLERGPIRSKHWSTNCSGVRVPPFSEASRSMMARTPGLCTLLSSLAMKLMRSTSEPLSIHSRPSCQPSTEGGWSKPCPM